MRLSSVFAALGYSVGVGPEVETDFYNFESMNFPPGHPARDTQDTLVVAEQERRPQRDRLLMRTHTSPVQMRTMESQPPPVRIVIPGKVHRNDARRRHALADLSSGGRAVRGHEYHLQRPEGHAGPRHEGAVRLGGEDALLSVVLSLHRAERGRADQLHLLRRQGLPQVQDSGWIELLGCGMVDPAVFAFAAEKQPGYDPKKISGFAFGMGVERIAMMKYGISEIGSVLCGGYAVFGAVCLASQRFRVEAAS